MRLNLPSYAFRTSQKEGKSLIFDAFRHRWVRLNPEEWVRQHFVRYLVEEKHYPASLISVERSLRFNKQEFRADAVIFSTAGKPLLVVECKAPEVAVSQKVFDQIIRYNFEFQVDFLIVTNGMFHYCCKIDKQNQTYDFLKEIPDYREINETT